VSNENHETTEVAKLLQSEILGDASKAARAMLDEVLPQIVDAPDDDYLGYIRQEWEAGAEQRQALWDRMAPQTESGLRPLNGVQLFHTAVNAAYAKAPEKDEIDPEFLRLAQEPEPTTEKMLSDAKELVQEASGVDPMTLLKEGEDG
tara:strand:+ start:3821 stop:4261 length:441 start_codon:yes stop_codon:yes gene_type:complete